MAAKRRATRPVRRRRDSKGKFARGTQARRLTGWGALGGTVLLTPGLGTLIGGGVGYAVGRKRDKKRTVTLRRKRR